MPGLKPPTKRVCANCIHWRPHIMYPWVGLCTLKSRLTLDEYSCESWSPIDFRGGGREFYWCLTCRRTIHKSEVERHVRAGHRVYVWVYVEPDIREEITLSSLE